MTKDELKSYLEKTFPGMTQEENIDFPVLWVEKDEIFEVAKKLKEDEATKFDFLFDETAIDWQTHFEMVYHMTSTTYRHDLEIKVKLEDRDHAELPSVEPLWKAAEMYENEIWDLFGIRFSGHPHLRRIFMSNEWKGYPLRKDYQDDDVISL